MHSTCRVLRALLAYHRLEVMYVLRALLACHRLEVMYVRILKDRSRSWMRRGRLVLAIGISRSLEREGQGLAWGGLRVHVEHA